ncbi:hypothetical protein [Aquimarina sp. MMG016]|uniref:hypothetical protein n=1 Tax=Aquimarina sp. MMG016 TaxID=2822690 RepID=UPI001B39EB26|nr:hypothetical protein [Aquimarina sp. MMG016]MBQ4821039.1 hypothetical protein [Aquimarina sp. MMG016]
MNTKIYLAIINFLLLGGIHNQSFSQTNNSIVNKVGVEIPSESVFVHYNTSLLFSGEYLYYKIYCINDENENLSELSKIAYLELVGEDKKTIAKQKIKLEEGQGQGDFFVSVSLPSGNYKIIAYTQWMKNKGSDNFFQGDLAIINPYQGNQTKLLEKSNGDNNNFGVKEQTQMSKSGGVKLSNAKNISLLLNKDNFKKRDEVSLKIKSSLESYRQGDYSISVRKIDTIDIPLKETAIKFKSLNKKNISKKINSIEELAVLPEFRGELVSGKLISNSSDIDLLNKKVALSIPGKEYEVKIATTDKNGDFYFNLDKEYQEDNAYLQVLGYKDRFKIELQEKTSLSYKSLLFNQFEITQEMEKMILDRSVYNQIRNGYFSLKPDTLVSADRIKPFYGDQVEIYDLDNYTRFSTVKETLVEVIDNAWIKKTQNGSSVFQVRYKHPPYNEPDYLPLVIVDGLIIQDHDDLVEYDSRKIKRITLSRDKHYLGSHVFQGILDIETKEGDYYSTINKNYINKVELLKPVPHKKYFHQSYNGNGNKNRIPDFRNQLLWNPNIKIEKEEIQISFFTSDNIGSYEICLEGFAKNGAPVSLRKIITVE